MTYSNLIPPSKGLILASLLAVLLSSSLPNSKSWADDPGGGLSPGVYPIERPAGVRWSFRPHTAMSGMASGFYVRYEDDVIESTGIVNEAFWFVPGVGSIPLGTLGGDRSTIFDISGNGDTIVGRSRTAEQVIGRGRNRTVIPSRLEAFIWQPDLGMLPLGVPDGGTSSHANAVNEDGSVVVGYVLKDNVRLGFRWTAATGMQYLDPTETRYHEPMFVSRDGDVVLGTVRNEIFVWSTDSPQLQVIPRPSGSLTAWHTVGTRVTSVDANVVVARAYDPQSHVSTGFVWTADRGTIYPESAPGGGGVYLTTVSPDGSTVLGSAPNAFGVWQPSYWIDATQHRFLEFTQDTGFFDADAIDSSYDGSRILGTAFNENYQELGSLVWDGPDYQMKTLEEVIEEYAIDTQGLINFRAHKISQDGKVLTCRAYDPFFDENVHCMVVLGLTNGGGPGSEDGDEGDDEDDDGDEGHSGELFASVDLVDVGPRGRHLDVIATVVDADGALVSGAAVEVAVQQVSSGQVTFESGTTGGNGTVSWRFSNADAADYVAEVLEVSYPN